MGRHLEFVSLPILPHSIPISPNGMLDTKNVRTAVEISSISCLEAEIHEVKRPPSWIFPLPVWSHSILRSPNHTNGMLNPENISVVAVAIGISYISCLGAELFTFVCI